MNINDPDNPAYRALKYLCEVGHGDPHLWFTVVSLSSDLGLSEVEGRSVFGFLVGKGLARYMAEGTIIPTDAGFQHMGYSIKRHKKKATRPEKEDICEPNDE
jgi:hypothetical protein